MSTLLQPGDPAPFGLDNEGGASPLVFAADHAGRAIPRALGDLGLSEAEMSRHIGWDIGIHGVTRRVAERLDAPYLFQPYSRLVIDCNRRPRHPQSVAERSDGTEVPGNLGLAAEAIEAREAEILHPYHDAMARLLDARQAAGRPAVLFAMHSCTPRLRLEGFDRPWQFSALADKDWRVGDALIAVMERETPFCIGRNEPYRVDAAVDYSVPMHAEARGLPYVEVEIRQDLIETEAGQREWADRLAALLPKVLEESGVLAG